MRKALVIILDENGKRVTIPMRWGFADLRATTPMERPKHIHARAETIDQLPTFRDAFANRRGIVLAETFNIGADVTPKKTIQHVVSPRDGKPLALAVLWEAWTHREEGALYTFVMVTVPANKLIAPKADRMPAILQPEDWPKWLGEEPASSEELKTMLKTVEGDFDMAPAAKAEKPRKKPDGQGDLF